MSIGNYEGVSRMVSYLLRHANQSHGLEMDGQGWVLLTDLILALHHLGVEIDESGLTGMVLGADKKRHEILGKKIRSLYGHSNVKIIKRPSEPPEILFHGTLQKNLEGIIKNGLLSMSRQYVHLSTEEAIARRVAGRRQGAAIVVKVHAGEAFMNSIQFYNEAGGIWLADFIPSKFITIL